MVTFFSSHQELRQKRVDEQTDLKDQLSRLSSQMESLDTESKKLTASVQQVWMTLTHQSMDVVRLIVSHPPIIYKTRRNFAVHGREFIPKLAIDVDDVFFCQFYGDDNDDEDNDDDDDDEDDDGDDDEDNGDDDEDDDNDDWCTTINTNDEMMIITEEVYDLCGRSETNVGMLITFSCINLIICFFK